MSAWPVPIGTRVRYIGASPGEVRSGRVHNRVSHWLAGGAEGEVVRIVGGYARHSCPDHDGGETCVCGDDSGWVDAQEEGPVVEYPCKCGEFTLPRVICSGDEGTQWEFVK